MARYLLQAAYTPEAWAAQIQSPADRTKVLQPLLEKLGGKFVETYFAFGEYDIVTIVDLPDNVSAAAFSLTASAGGAIKAVKTTPLMTIEEGLQAMRKAQEVGQLYQSPIKQPAGTRR
jgi:uncharacterized protein with GYD domain